MQAALMEARSGLMLTLTADFWPLVTRFYGAVSSCDAPQRGCCCPPFCIGATTQMSPWTRHSLIA